MKFKAAILEKINEPLAVREIETTDLKIGQVLVKIVVSGICGAQLHEIRGYKGNEKFLPHLMGHEGCGIVEEIGPGVSFVKPGDRVVMHWRIGAGIESDFPNYILDGKKISSGKITTLSEYSIVSENRLTKIPNDVSYNFGAILGCALTTALGIVDNEIDLKFGESTLVIGCGGVGLNLIQALSMKNANPIFSVDKDIEKTRMAIQCNTDYFFTSLDDIHDKIDVIIDTTGSTDIIRKAASMLSNNGRLILVGQPSPGSSIEVANAINLFSGSGQTIKATQGGKTQPNIDIPRYVKLYQSGKLNIDHLITHSYDLPSINEAFDLLKTGKAGRIMIQM